MYRWIAALLGGGTAFLINRKAKASPGEAKSWSQLTDQEQARIFTISQAAEPYYNEPVNVLVMKNGRTDITTQGYAGKTVLRASFASLSAAVEFYSRAADEVVI